MNKALDKKMEEENLEVVQIGLFRKVLCEEFKKQGPAVIKEYETKAVTERMINETAGPLEGEERERYLT